MRCREVQLADAGRPRIIDSPEEFDRLVDEYVAKCREEDEPVTFTGMALHLGFVARQSLYDYQGYDGFSDSVRRARSLVEAEYEKRLAGNNVAGSIFALKNHGWSDRQELEHSGNVPAEVRVTYVEADDGDD